MKKIINAELVKQENRIRILKLLYKNSLSRSNLAILTGLTKAAISIIVDDLLLNGYIEEGNKNDSTGGRKSVLLKIKDTNKVIGSIYFDRDNYEVGILTLSGKSINITKGIVNRNNPYETLENIANDLSNIIGNRRLLAIGIACPGPINKEKGILGKISNFECYEGINLYKYFNDIFKVNIYIDNISNALLKAEYIKNVRLNDKCLELIIDSGFGSSVGLIKDNLEITECELGHTTINIFGKRCSCGNVGCAELYVNKDEYKNNYLQFILALSSVILNSINAFNIKNVVLFFKECDGIDKVINDLQDKLEGKEINIFPSILENNYSFIAGNMIIDNVLDELIKK